MRTPDADVVKLDPDACAVSSVDPEKVAAAVARLLPAEELARLAELFKLFSDPTRLRILYSLVEAGELCVCDLSEVVGAPETSVSHALRLLRMAKVVESRRAGRQVYSRVADHHVRLVLELAAEHLRHEDER